MIQVAVHVVTAVVKLMLIVASGVYFAWVCKPEKKALSAIAQVSATIMTPALTFSSIVGALSIHQLEDSWLLPVCVCYVVVGSSLLTFLAATCLLPTKFRPLAMLCVTFNNTISFPINILQSLATNIPWIREDLELAISLCFVFHVFMTPFMWFIGTYVIEYEKKEQRKRISSFEEGTLLVTNGQEGQSDAQQNGSASTTKTLRAWWSSFCLKHKSTFEILRQCVNAPFVAAILTLIVLAIPSLQRHFTDSESGYLYVFYAALRVVGEGTVPLTLVLLGANLYLTFLEVRKEVSEGREGTVSNSEVQGSTPAKPFPLPPRVVFVVTVLRLLVVPLGLGLSFFYLFRSTLPRWRVLHLVYLVQVCCPTAIQLGLIFSMRHYMTHEVSLLIFFLYVACPFTICACLVVILMLLSP